jgi:DNA repair protein SbcD/Mre11
MTMGIPFRFMHAADLHLDSPFKGLADVPPHVRDALKDSTFTALKRLTDAAIEEEVDWVVFAGDLYDAADRSLRAQSALHQAWTRLSAHGIGVFVIHGNHDPLSGERARMALPDGVHVFGSSEVEGRPAYRRDGKLAAYVYGISYGSRAVTENLSVRYRPDKQAPYHIALLHGNVDGDSSHDPYAPCALSDLAGAGFDYWALGHIHARRVLHEFPHVVYSGNVQGRHVRESGAKGCYIVDVSGDKDVRLSFRALDAVRWSNVAVSIDGVDHMDGLLMRMEEACESAAELAEGRPLMLGLELYGSGRLHRQLSDAAAIADLLLALRERIEASGPANGTGGAWLWVHRLTAHTAASVDLAAIAEEDSFAGELLRLSAQLQDDPEAEAQLLNDALAPLMEHARLRRLLRERGAERSAERQDRMLAHAAERLAQLLTDEEGAS